jgi:CRP-like cAMP-binding protein
VGPQSTEPQPYEVREGSSRRVAPHGGRISVLREKVMIGPMPAVVDELKRVPLFSSLSQRQLRRLARQFKEREFRPGRPVVQQGQMSGVGFFVIAEGEASVSVDGLEVTRLGPGDHFGELALISRKARTATVTAETPLRCLVIAIWDFRSFAKDSPDVSWTLLEQLVDLLTEDRNRRATASSQTS